MALDAERDAEGMQSASQVLTLQVPVVGPRGVGKSALLRAAADEARAAPSGGAAEEPEDTDGLCLQRISCEFQGLRFVLELLEVPATGRYLPLLPHLAAASACTIFMLGLERAAGLQDFEERLAMVGGSLHSGLVVAMSRSSPPSSEELQRLERVRSLASPLGLQVVRFGGAQELVQGRILRTLCGLVTKELPEQVDAMHLFGARLSAEPA